MKENTIEKLRKSGLTGNESKVYYELLKNTSISANQLSKKIGMDRTLTYTVLNNLIEKGMVNYTIKDNKKYFNASSPENLLNPIKEKEHYIKNILPDLKSIKKSLPIESKINIYEGKEGIRAFTRILIKHSNFDSFGATGRAYDLLIESPRLVKELEKKNTKIRIITNFKYKKHPMNKINIEMKYLDIESEATTTIFKDHIAIHIIKEKPTLILIKNKFISNSYKNHFELLWKIANKQ
jgi:sugar-specific transcriptional regulator TrmB